MKKYSINTGYDQLNDDGSLKIKYWLLRQVGSDTILNLNFDRLQVISYFNNNMEDGDICYIHEKSGRVQKKMTIIKKEVEKVEDNQEQIDNVVKMIDYLINKLKVIHVDNDVIKTQEFKPHFNGTFKQFIGSIKVFQPVDGYVPFQFTEQNLKIIKSLENDQNLFIGKYRRVGATTLIALHIIYKTLTIEDYKVYIPRKRSNVGLHNRLKTLIDINPDLIPSKDRIMSCIDGNVKNYCNQVFTERIIEDLDIQTYQRLYQTEDDYFRGRNLTLRRNIITSGQLGLEDYFTSLGFKFKRLIMERK